MNCSCPLLHVDAVACRSTVAVAVQLEKEKEQLQDVNSRMHQQALMAPAKLSEPAPQPALPKPPDAAVGPPPAAQGGGAQVASTHHHLHPIPARNSQIIAFTC